MTALDDWDSAPCALLALRTDGTVVSANAAAREWTGRAGGLDGVHFSELLSVGGRIFWETHLSPLLHVEGRVDEVVLELKGTEGRIPVLLTAVVQPASGVVHVALSSARGRTQYERELLAARAAAERSDQQVRALQDVTAQLSRALGTGAIADALLAAAVGRLGAAAATLWLVDGDAGLIVHGAAGEGEGEAALPTAGVLLHERRPVDDSGRLVVPLHGSTALQGVLSLRPRDDAGADPLDVEVLTSVGQQAGLALDRAQLYEQSANVAHELQRSLLAGAPPEDARFSVATVYRPGVEMLEVGGDWYDVFLAEEGVLSVIVGDVVGRGLGAATAMGQLRSAVRAVAGPGVGPARLVSRLDRFVEQVEAAGMATLVYAELDLRTGVMRYACAGHPPPLLLGREGGARLLWDGRSTPLGAFLHAESRAEAEVQLVPGDRLVLYTDGLIERRDRALDDGLALLVASAEATTTQPLGEAVRSLTSNLLLDEAGRDDVCVLLLAWSGTEFERQVSADLTGLSTVRADLGRWLQAQGADDDAQRDLVLATSEAVANAAEHGSGGRASERVRVRVRVDSQREGPDDAVITVHDRGRWRTPTAADERGRGLMIIGALVDDVVVDAGDGTTIVLRRRMRGTA